MSTMHQKEFKPILMRGERLLWTSEPNFICFAVVPPLFVFGISAVLYFVGQFVSPDNDFPFGLNEPQVGSAIALAISIFLFLYTGIKQCNTFYAFTDNRVIIKTGVLGIDYSSIDYSKITDIAVKRGPIEMLFSVGTVIPYTASNTDTKQTNLCSIPKPYDAFNLLKTKV